MFDSEAALSVPHENVTIHLMKTWVWIVYTVHIIDNSNLNSFSHFENTNQTVWAGQLSNFH